MKARKAWVVALLAVVGCSAPDDPLPPGDVTQQTELQADLVADFRHSTLSLANGQDLDAAVIVRNRGAGASQPATGRWDLRGPALQATKSVAVPALKPNQTVRLPFHYPFAPTQSGSFVLAFTPNDDGRLPESNTRNNRDAITVVVAPPEAPPPPANLAVTFETSSVTFDMNAHIVAEVTLTNLRDEALPVEGIWELEGAGVYVAVSVTVPVLDANASTKLLFSQPPNPEKRGRFTLTFTAFPGENFVETDSADNAAVMDVVVVPYPNLRVEILSASPLAVSSAAEATLRIKWSNDGLSPVTYPADISEPARIYLMKSGEAPDWRNFARAVTVPAIAAGESMTVDYPVRALRGGGAYAWHVTSATSYESSLADNAASLGGATVLSMLQTVWVSAVTSPSIATPSTAAVGGDAAWDLLIGGLRTGSGENDLFAIDGSTGAPLWSTAVLGVPLVLRSSGNAAALTFSADEQMLAAFAASTGVWSWQYPAGPTYISYVSADLDQDATADLLVAGYDGLSLLDLTDGSVLDQWLLPQSGNSFAASPVLAEFTNDSYPDVILATLEGRGYAFSNTAGTGLTMAWEAVFAAPVVGTPLVTDLTADAELEVVFGDNSGRLYVIEATTGTSLWSVTTPVERIWMAPTVVRRASGLAVVVSGSRLPSLDGWSSSLLAYDGVSGSLLWRVDRPGSPGSVVAIDVDHDGFDELLWLVGDRSPAVYPLVLPSLVGARGSLYVLSGDGAIQTVVDVPGAAWSPPLAGDLDLDGWLDIIVSGAGPDGAVTRLSTPWTWPAGSGWVGASGSSIP